MRVAGRSRARLVRAAAVTGALALCAGCGGPVKTRAYALALSPAANANSPVPVEMVAVYSRAMLEEVAGLTARDWFQRRAQLARDYPDGWRSVRWELVPGQTVALRRLELSRRGARALFVWADYQTEGPHRVRLDPFAQAILEFGETDVAVRRAP